MASILVQCPSCKGEQVYRHGKARSGIQRYRCRDCHHCFQLEYRYEANKPGVTDKISDLSMNGSGVRDTGRVLGISVTTVIAHLKNWPHRPSPPSRSTRSAKKRVWSGSAKWMNSGRLSARRHNNAGYGRPGPPILNGSLPMRWVRGVMTP